MVIAVLVVVFLGWDKSGIFVFWFEGGSRGDDGGLVGGAKKIVTIFRQCVLKTVLTGQFKVVKFVDFYLFVENCEVT